MVDNFTYAYRALSKTGESGAVDSTNSSIVTNTVATEAKKDTKTNFNVPSRSQEHVKPNQGTTVSTSNKESELARDIQQQINEARIVASEKEIETLQKALLQEKQQNATLNMHIQQLQVRVQQEMSEKEEAIKASNSAMTNFAPGLNPSFNAFFPTDSSSKAQIQQHEVSQGVDESNMKAQSTQIEFKPLHASENSAFLKEFVKDFTLPFPLSENEQVKVLLRRVNNMKKVAKIEIGELYDKVNQVQEQNLRDKESLNNKSKATINEMKQQLATIKDENVRKTKLLNALKAAKASDSNSLEQWKNEVKQQEDTIKRLQRTLTSKDALTKDLRNKADALEEALTIAEKGLSSETNTNDMYQLTAPELRARLKEYDLERARSKARLQALKDKISELEHEIVILKEENERLKKNTDKSDAMKASMGRKDTLIANMKAQIEKLKTELEECKHQELVSQAENEKRIK